MTLPTKFCLVKAMVFPVVMYGCDSWAIRKTEHQRIDSFELWCWRRLESSLDCRDIKPVNPKGNQPRILIGRTDAEAETPILFLPDEKSQLTGKDPDTGKYWRQEEKGIAEDKMAGWHHQLDWHEFEQATGAGDGQGSPTCCSPWCCKELDMTERLNWTDWRTLEALYAYKKTNLNYSFFFFFGVFLICPYVTKHLLSLSNAFS